MTFVYRFQSEEQPPVALRLKIEVNTREHFAVYGVRTIPFAVESDWFSGRCRILTYELDELLGTKLRALFQRKQGRDLFDLATALARREVDPSRIVAAFVARHEGQVVTRSTLEANLLRKLEDPLFTADLSPLLAANVTWDVKVAASLVISRLVDLVPD